MVIVDILLPLSIDTLYSYRIDSELLECGVEVGSFVAVPIGKKKILGGLVVAIREGLADEGGDLRPVASLLSSRPIVTTSQLKFWFWLSEYYLIPIGYVAYNFLPASLKLSAEYGVDEMGEMQFELSNIFGQKEFAAVKIASKYNTPELIEELLNSLKRGKRREKLILEMLEEAGVENSFTHLFLVKELNVRGYNTPLISDLVKSGILVKESVTRSLEYQVAKYSSDLNFNITDNPIWQQFEAIESSMGTTLFESQNIESEEHIICAKIDQILSKKGVVLFVTPFINNSNRYINLFSKRFGSNLVIYDKKKSKSNLHQQYSTILNCEEGLLVVAGRSGVGLPFKELSLVIVEREHDQLYLGSQHEMSYNGRDTAVYLAFQHRAQAILISAAPSIESIYNCEIGKYRFISEKQDFSSKIVAIERRNIARDERKLYESSSHRRFLSKFVIDEIDRRTTKGEMVFIYQNRKGFSTILECVECGEYQQCDNCNTTLAYFKSSDSLVCRYCGTHYNKNQQCRACGSLNFREHGVGTENVEERVKELFPLLRVVRIDAESIKRREEFQSIIKAIADREIDIVIGTQILFSLPIPDNLTLIGVVNGDNLFTISDHRGNERAFQLLTYLRMMLRDDKDSVMVLQMSQHLTFLKNFIANNYKNVYLSELSARREFDYPPICKIITYRVVDSDCDRLDRVSNEFMLKLRYTLNAKVLDVVTPLVDKIRGKYIREVVIKCDNGRNFPIIKSQSCDIATEILKKIKWSVTII